MFVANKLKLTAEELFLIQTVYDYQKGNENFDKEYLKELKTNYTLYYQSDAVDWDTLVKNLVKRGFLDDFRIDPTSYNLGELVVSEAFLLESGNLKTDRELFDIAKAKYPTYYYTGYNGQTSLNMNVNLREEEEMFTTFKKKILSGNRAKNWEQFLYILENLNPEGKQGVSSFKFDRFINTFWDNLEEHIKSLGE
jgi:hypothetical protein